MLTKKSIVMSGVNNSSQRAVLSIENDGENTRGRLRLYNFGLEPKGILSLGIFNNGKVVKAGLIRSSQMLYTFACQTEKLDNNFSCAVINFVGGEPNPILYGSGDGYTNQDEIYSQVLKKLNNTNSAGEVEKVLDEFNVDFDDKLKSDIEDEIDKCLGKEDIDKMCDSCENCKYKQFYLSNIKTQNIEENNSEEIEENIEEKVDEESKQFYMELKGQIDELFENNPSEDYLQDLIPSSKWVKVNIDDNGNYYVLGLIYEGENLQYICYGLPGVYQKNSPRELSGYPVWFPLEESKPQGFGYWLSYQDANSGEAVKAVVV